MHSDHNAPRGNDDEEDVKEPMVSAFADCTCVADVNEGEDVTGYDVCLALSNSSNVLGVPSGSQQQRVSRDVTHRTQRPPRRGGRREIGHQGNAYPSHLKIL